MPSKLKVALIRGSYLNPNELANYSPLVNDFVLTSFSSLKPLGTHPKIPNCSLFSPFDLFHNWPAPVTAMANRITKYITNRTWGDPHRLFGLEKQIRDYQILDVADPYYYFSFQAAIVRRSNPITRLLVTFCETIPHNNEGTVAKKRIKQFVLKTADLVICHTSLSRLAALKEGVSAARIRVIPLGVDLAQFHPVANRPESILFVGRLVPEKGVLVLYDAFKRLSKTYPNLKLNLVGAGPLEKAIKELTRRDNLTNRVTIRAIPYSKISQSYRVNEYFVLPSYSNTTWEEQYGVALVEAMASGMAIVATKSGAIPEVLGKAGIIVPPKSSTHLAQALEKLIRNVRLRKKLKIAAHERAKRRYSHSLFADKIKAVYEELISGNPGAQRRG